MALGLLALVFGATTDFIYTAWQRRKIVNSTPDPRALAGMEHPLYHHDLRPMASYDNAMWGPLRYSIRVNSLGFRDFEAREIGLVSDSTRVLIIGDSFGEGAGYDYDSTLAGVAARRLNDRGVELLNASVAAYTPKIAARKLEYLFRERGLKVDFVICMIDFSDLDDELHFEMDANGAIAKKASLEKERTGFELAKEFARTRFTVPGMIHRAIYGPYRRSATILMNQALHINNLRTDWSLGESIPERVRPGLTSTIQSLDLIRTLCEEQGIGLAVAIHPWPDHLYYRSVAPAYRNFWMAWCAERNLPLLDLFPVFMADHFDSDSGAGDSAAAVRKFFIPFDMHYNAEGNRVYGESLADFVSLQLR